MKKIAIYHKWIPKVGGIETAVYVLAKQLSKKYDVTIIYDGYQVVDSLFHYAEVANVKNLKAIEGDFYDIALLASNHPKPKALQAHKFLQWIHSDYKKYNLRLVNKGDVEYVSVSKHAAKVIKELEDVDSTVIYNLVDDLKRRAMFKLVTVSRVSPEKGFGRMLEMANRLNEKNLNWRWTVVGDNATYPNEFYDWVQKFSHLEQVTFVGYKKDVVPYIQEADYLVQLSDWEGCPYSVLEALQLEVPCIVTQWGGVEELIQDGVNGYILDMSLKNLDLSKIIAEQPEVKKKNLSTLKEWEKVMGLS